MAKSESKKEMIAQYKDREVIGGVYAIRNAKTGKQLVDATGDLQSARNRFEFSKQTGSCTELRLREDWNRHGCDSFVFEVLEELVKGKDQSTADYRADIAVLKQMWLEKTVEGNLY